MPHSIFVRSTGTLPAYVGVLVEPFAGGWAHVEQMESRAFDAMIRQAKWHYMWVHGSYSQRGFGRSEETAIRRALERALQSVSPRFNVAEFDSLQISRFPGFYIASVRMNTRQILQNNGLKISYLQGPESVDCGITIADCRGASTHSRDLLHAPSAPKLKSG